MRLVNCSIVEGGRCLYSGSKFIVLYRGCALALSLLFVVLIEKHLTLFLQDVRAAHSKGKGCLKNMHKLPNIVDKLLVQEAVKCTTEHLHFKIFRGP